MKSIIAVLLLGLAVQTVLADIGDDLQNLNVSALGLPANVSQNIPTQEEAEKVLEDKCRKNGGEEAVQKAKKAKEAAQECAKNLVNMEELQQEMDKATPTGDLDLVFKKYCKKSPHLISCINNFTTDFEACLDKDERTSKDVVLNVTESLVNFVCFKDGDRIALFIAEGGPDCLNASQDAIKSCVQKTYSKHIPEDGASLENLPMLLFRAEECEEFNQLQKCVVAELEKCKEPTPANIVDSLFNFVRRVTPCAGKTSTASMTTRSSAPQHVSVGVASSLMFTVASYFTLRLSR